MDTMNMYKQHKKIGFLKAPPFVNTLTERNKSSFLLKSMPTCRSNDRLVSNLIQIKLAENQPPSSSLQETRNEFRLVPVADTEVLTTDTEPAKKPEQAEDHGVLSQLSVPQSDNPVLIALIGAIGHCSTESTTISLPVGTNIIKFNIPMNKGGFYEWHYIRAFEDLLSSAKQFGPFDKMTEFKDSSSGIEMYCKEVYEVALKNKNKFIIFVLAGHGIALPCDPNSDPTSCEIDLIKGQWDINHFVHFVEQLVEYHNITTHISTPLCYGYLVSKVKCKLLGVYTDSSEKNPKSEIHLDWSEKGDAIFKHSKTKNVTEEFDRSWVQNVRFSDSMKNNLKETLEGISWEEHAASKPYTEQRTPKASIEEVNSSSYSIQKVKDNVRMHITEDVESGCRD